MGEGIAGVFIDVESASELAEAILDKMLRPVAVYVAAQGGGVDTVASSGSLAREVQRTLAPQTRRRRGCSEGAPMVHSGHLEGARRVVFAIRSRLIALLHHRRCTR